MKTLKWTVLVVIAMFFIVGLSFMAWSGPQLKQTTEEDTKVVPASTLPELVKCPSGWHKKAGVHKLPEIVCVPDKPKQPIKCLDGTEYYECVKDGQCCEVGCKEVPGTPR